MASTQMCSRDFSSPSRSSRARNSPENSTGGTNSQSCLADCASSRYRNIPSNASSCIRVRIAYRRTFKAAFGKYLRTALSPTSSSSPMQNTARLSLKLKERPSRLASSTPDIRSDDSCAGVRA